MAAQGFAVSVAGVADYYRDFLDLLVVDSQDAPAAEELRKTAVRVHCTPTIMRKDEDRIALAKSVLEAAMQLLSAQTACVVAAAWASGYGTEPSQHTSRIGGARMILVPVKNLVQHAKQRLSSVLSPEERFALAQAMCEDVLQALARSPSHPAVVVVTHDSFARDLAARFNFEAVADDNCGETNAIEMATAMCKQRGARSTLVVPADIPLIERVGTANDCRQRSFGRCGAGAGRGEGRGTNAAWRSPSDLFPLRFGNDSFLPHLAAAKATGLPCVVLELPGIARDVDRPEDLRELACQGRKAIAEARAKLEPRSRNR